MATKWDVFQLHPAVSQNIKIPGRTETEECWVTLVPVSGALEPVEDVGAAGVVDLVEGVGVGLLHRHGVAAEEGGLLKNTIKRLTDKPAYSTSLK